MNSLLQQIDWITVQKDLSFVAERYRDKARQCESLAASSDGKIVLHADYHLSVAARYAEMARLVDDLWLNLETFK